MEKKKQPTLLSQKQASDRLGLSTKTISCLCEAQAIICVKLGGLLRIPESEIAKIVESRVIYFS
jgi:excisionase family DNA binding protein